jgi:hypothetical protein
VDFRYQALFVMALVSAQVCRQPKKNMTISPRPLRLRPSTPKRAEFNRIEPVNRYETTSSTLLNRELI